MKKVFLSVLVLATVFMSCKKDDEARNGIFRGPAIKVHGGKAWTWVQLDSQGNPLRAAVTIDDKAMNSVPVGTGHDGGGHDMMDNMWTLKFHAKGIVLPFNHVGMGWNPNGHEPENIYTQPHFDFHFYSMTPDEVAAIPVYEAAKEKFDNRPAPEYFPATYINPGGGVPMMGAHWIDVTSPEFHGQLFTQTFIFGSYDGKVTFYEPMITKAFLLANSNYERDIPQPAKVQQTGYYPTKMRVVKHDGVTEIILDGFVKRVQS